MLIGTIRPLETATVTVEAHSLAEAHAMLEQQRPEGFELTDAPVTMKSGTTLLTALGTYARRDGVQEIEADDMETLRAKVPDGWILLTARSL